MLCEPCYAVFQQPVEFTRSERRPDGWAANFDYQITVSELKKQAETCYVCHSNVFKLAAHLPTLGNAVLDQAYHLVGDGKESTRLIVSTTVDGKALVRHPICIQRAADEAPQYASQSTGSRETLRFIKDCLRQCQTHETCSAIGETWYPTRLVRIQQDSLNLVDSAEIKVPKPYASLSHCWGGAEILNLTTRNLADLQHDIPFHLLPATFQDAVKVARSLDIGYIWIDSLCIIQDSTEDWQKEAHDMLKVYRHALCNIAAAASPNSFAGLFRQRNPKILGADVRVDNGALKGHYHLVNEHYFMQEVDDAPLNQRSWVAQERVLSRRIIHFASEQVLWDCNQLTASESLPLGTKIWPKCGWGRLKIGCKQGSQLLTLPETVDQGLGQWARIVDTYSGCGLTVLGDKLTAISGMAEHLQKALGLEYCAGMWREKMEIQLAWHAVSPLGLRNDLAPTWSWVSLNGEVWMQQVDEYQGYDIKLLAHVTEVSLSRRVEGRGERYTGLLRLRCVLNPVTVIDGRLHGRGMEHARNLLVDSLDMASEGLFFVPLFDLHAANSVTDPRLVHSEIRGIVVRPVEGRPGTYTRCGHAFLSSETLEDTKAFPTSYEEVKSPVGKENFPCENYSSAGHLIALV